MTTTEENSLSEYSEPFRLAVKLRGELVSRSLLRFSKVFYNCTYLLPLLLLCAGADIAQAALHYLPTVPLGISLGPARGGGQAPTYYHSAVADFNCDGREDVALALAAELRVDHPPYPIMILLNNGQGSFVDGTNEIIVGAVPEMFWPKKLIAMDFNGDGRPDLFIAGTGLEASFPDFTQLPGEQNFLLLSTPDCTLVNAIAQNLPEFTDFSHGADAADVDGDGDIDLWVNNLGGNPSNAHAYLMLNDGTGKFMIVADLGFEFLGNVIVGLNGRLPAEVLNSWHPLWAQFVDADGDGDPDLYFGYLEDFNRTGVGRTVLLINDGTGRFTLGAENAIPLPPFSGKGQAEWSEMADINRDGFDDLILHMTEWGTYLGYKIQLLISNGDGTFRDETDLRLPSQSEALDFFCTEPLFWLRDMTGDGNVDILVKKFGIGCQNPFTVFYVNDGNGFFTNLPHLLPELNPGAIPVDVDGDGAVDFLDQFFNGVTGQFELRLTKAVRQPPICSVAGDIQAVAQDANTPAKAIASLQAAVSSVVKACEFLVASNVLSAFNEIKNAALSLEKAVKAGAGIGSITEQLRDFVVQTTEAKIEEAGTKVCTSDKNVQTAQNSLNQAQQATVASKAISLLIKAFQSAEKAIATLLNVTGEWAGTLRVKQNGKSANVQFAATLAQSNTVLTGSFQDSSSRAGDIGGLICGRVAEALNLDFADGSAAGTGKADGNKITVKLTGTDSNGPFTASGNLTKQ